jgi:hypothetical protein
MTYRWGVVCPGCYLTLDNSSGAAEISGRFFNLASASRGDRARTIGVQEYLQWAAQRGGEAVKHANRPQHPTPLAGVVAGS